MSFCLLLACLSLASCANVDVAVFIPSEKLSQQELVQQLDNIFDEMNEALAGSGITHTVKLIAVLEAPWAKGEGRCSEIKTELLEGRRKLGADIGLLVGSAFRGYQGSSVGCADLTFFGVAQSLGHLFGARQQSKRNTNAVAVYVGANGNAKVEEGDGNYMVSIMWNDVTDKPWYDVTDKPERAILDERHVRQHTDTGVIPRFSGPDSKWKPNKKSGEYTMWDPEPVKTMERVISHEGLWNQFSFKEWFSFNEGRLGPTNNANTMEAQGHVLANTETLKRNDPDLGCDQWVCRPPMVPKSKPKGGGGCKGSSCTPGECCLTRTQRRQLVYDTASCENTISGAWGNVQEAECNPSAETLLLIKVSLAESLGEKDGMTGVTSDFTDGRCTFAGKDRDNVQRSGAICFRDYECKTKPKDELTPTEVKERASGEDICQFPFTFAGAEYHTCTDDARYGGKYDFMWCYHKDGDWGVCSESCVQTQLAGASALSLSYFLISALLAVSQL